MRGLVRTALVCALAVAAAGCASPVARMYTLDAVAKADGAPAVRPPVSLVVGPVSIPALVDQPQMVVRQGSNQVVHDEFNRWASPLAEDISRVLAIDLGTLLGSSQVRQFQQATGADGDYRVSLDVQAFDSVAGEAASLRAGWTVRRARDGKTVSGASSVREPVTGPGYDALAAAHSRALARVSGEIAGAIRGFQP